MLSSIIKQHTLFTRATQSIRFFSANAEAKVKQNSDSNISALHKKKNYANMAKLNHRIAKLSEEEIKEAEA